MRSLWIIISTLAIANLLGIGAFVGWLAATDRLSKDRMTKIREMLAKTNAQERADVAASEAAQAEAAKAAAAEAKMRVPPESSPDAMVRTTEADELAALRLARTRDEVRQMQQQLDARQWTLDREREQLEADKKALEAKTTEVARTLGSEQFKQALASLEAQKPADARKVLQALIDQQRVDQAVLYLSAMTERARARILAEFIKADKALAASLLEQLRTRGITGEASSAPPAAPVPVGSGG